MILTHGFLGHGGLTILTLALLHVLIYQTRQGIFIRALVPEKLDLKITTETLFTINTTSKQQIKRKAILTFL